MNEEDYLVPYAATSKNTRGRKYEEKSHPYRTPFQRDRDRIIHSSSFRRLEYKTQVFIYHEGDYYRTRLTHSIEVAQITRSIARVLGVNQDLSEAIALSHDLGHPPFGHSGEKALNDLMRDYGGFEHNHQSLRIVDYLEHRYPMFRGLNLSWEIREGLAKHSTRYDTPKHEEFSDGLCPTVEAQIVDYADSIAYNSHDLDDGVESHMLNILELENIRLWRKNFKKITEKYSNIDFKIKKYQVIKMIINDQVSDLVTHTLNNIKKYSISNIEDVRQCKAPLAAFSPEMQEFDRELKEFLFKNLYRHYRVVRMEIKARRFIEKLFKAYRNNPELLPPPVYKNIGDKDTDPRVICDYIAGMTDRYALNEYKKLFDPYEKV